MASAILRFPGERLASFDKQFSCGSRSQLNILAKTRKSNCHPRNHRKW